MTFINARVILGALEYFSAAARHLNFRRAANEIGVTPGAVSQRIKALEDFLGHPLFIRRPGGVELTPNGERLKEATNLVLAKLGDTVERIRLEPAKDTLTVTVSPYFGSHWLSHRLIHFWELHPDIELRLCQLLEPIAFDQLDTDVLIRYGRDVPERTACESIMMTRSVAVCSPDLQSAYLQRRSSPVADATLLHFRSRQYWIDWLETANLPTHRAWTGPIVDDIHLLMEAAASGQGLVLGTRPVIDDDLKSKRLVLAHPSEWIGGYSYQFICRPGGLDIEKIRSFYNWISAEARYLSQ